MKFSAGTSIIILASINDGARAFVGPSSSPTNRAAFTSSSSSSSSASSLASLLLAGGEGGVGGTDHPSYYTSMIDAISSAANAAHSAAQKSSDLASSLILTSSSSSDTAVALMTPASVRAGLSVLEGNVASSTDPAVMFRAMMDALDATVLAAERAASSTSALTSNLADIDAALLNSMALSSAQHHSSFLLTPEAADMAQAKLALLIHNLSGASVSDTFLGDLWADVDRRLDSLHVSPSSVVAYGTLAFVLAYTQRREGVRSYKMELRKMLEMGELDIKALAQDVGLPVEVEVVTVSEEARLEDPAIVMATMSGERPGTPWNEGAGEARQVEALLTTAALAITENAKIATPQPPMEDVPMKVLMKTATFEDLKADVAQHEISTSNLKVKGDAILMKGRSRRIAASPLARLLAEELGLDLTHLGKGSGRDGKILIDDVRDFHAKITMLKNTGRAYFATVSA